MQTTYIFGTTDTLETGVQTNFATSTVDQDSFVPTSVNKTSTSPTIVASTRPEPGSLTSFYRKFAHPNEKFYSSTWSNMLRFIFHRTFLQNYYSWHLPI